MCWYPDAIKQNQDVPQSQLRTNLTTSQQGFLTSGHWEVPWRAGATFLTAFVPSCPHPLLTFSPLPDPVMARHGSSKGYPGTVWGNTPAWAEPIPRGPLPSWKTWQFFFYLFWNFRTCLFKEQEAVNVREEENEKDVPFIQGHSSLSPAGMLCSSLGSWHMFPTCIQVTSPLLGLKNTQKGPSRAIPVTSPITDPRSGWR